MIIKSIECKIAIWLVLFAGTTLAQTASTGSEAKPIAPALFSRQIKKIIAIITTTCKDEPGTYTGTGFFVGKDDELLKDGQQFGYLVTNKHVAMPHSEDGTPCIINSQQIRVNQKVSNPINGSRTVSFTNKMAWTTPEDPSIDLAAIQFVPDPKIADILTVPISLFATDEIITKENIAEGDPVVYAGYFYQFPGLIQNEPIVRQGIIAMMPNEPILTTLKRPGSGFLADAHVFGGNSGSPMFVNLGGARNGALMTGTRYMLIGVVSGLEEEGPNGDLHPVVTYSGKDSGNSGISFVVPASQVADLINSPAMKKLRQEVLENLPTSPK